MDNLNPIERLNADLRQGAVTLGDHEARFLVDAYYIIQEDRKRSFAQERTLQASSEPHSIISWFAQQNAMLEKQIEVALDRYTRGHEMGSWMREVYGIGPVLSAGLLAHIDIEKASTAGHIWHFAGIAGDNQKPWLKGEKRPFNAGLKTLCWKIGQSFMKLSGSDKCFYGKLYRQRKELEIKKNEAGDFAEQAARCLPNFSKTTQAYGYYLQGKLPPAHIDARARRYAVKIFLSHVQAEWYRRHFHQEPPKPFAIAILGHAHMIEPGINSTIREERTTLSK